MKEVEVLQVAATQERLWMSLLKKILITWLEMIIGLLRSLN